MPLRIGQPSLRRFLGVTAQVLAAALIITGAASLLRLANNQSEQTSLPPDWKITRPPHEASCLAYYGGDLWVGGVDGLSRVDRQSAKLLTLPASSPKTGYVHCILVLTSGELLVGCESGLLMRRDTTWRTIADDQGSSGRVLCLLETISKEVLLGVDGGIYTLREGVIEPVDLGALTPHKIDMLYQDQAGVIWAGCSTAGQGQLLSRDTGGWQEATFPGLPHPAINSMAEDSTGTLWVGTGFAGNGGAAMLAEGRWQVPPGPAKLGSCKVRSVTRDSKGRMWFGLEYDGVIIYDHGSWHELNPGDGLAGKEVKAVLEDSDAVYWLGTDQGLSMIILP